MADQKQLIHWFLQNQKPLEARILEFTWAKRHAMDYYDFQVEIKSGDFSGNGRGTDLHPELALIKAVAEAVERIVCLSHCLSTVGVAAHTNRELAQRAATDEATERFLFSWHTQENIPFRRIASPAKYNLANSATLEFFEMLSPASCNAIISRISMRSGQKFLGLAYGQSLHSTCEKAFLEAARNLAAFEEDSTSFLETVKFDKTLWWCDSTYINKIDHLFQTQSHHNTEVPKFTAHLEPVSLANCIGLSDCPLFIERAVMVRAV